MNEHYTPYQDRYGLWTFTSPLGKHGPFWTKVIANKAVEQTRDAHLKRSLDDGAESAILWEWWSERVVFRKLPEPKVVAQPCKPPFKYHKLGADGHCRRCHVKVSKGVEPQQEARR